MKSVFILFSLFLTLNNYAYADNQPNIEIENLWIVLPPSVARSTAGYGRIKNSGDISDTLLHIHSNAGTVMLHKTNIEAGMARMIHMPNMVIEPGGEITLEPMSFHLMFTNLCPIIFTEGGKIMLFLEFDKSGAIGIEAPLRTAWD